MAGALIGKVLMTVNSGVQQRYIDKLLTWQDRATREIDGNIGYVDGLLLHYWHGKKKDRQYSDRWKILVEDKFDPDLDLKRDAQGLWQLTDRNPKLRDDLRCYFRSRNEDSIDL